MKSEFKTVIEVINSSKDPFGLMNYLFTCSNDEFWNFLYAVEAGEVPEIDLALLQIDYLNTPAEDLFPSYAS